MKDNSLRQTTIITTLVCLIPIIFGILFYTRLPETVVIHWDADGNPNGWAPKFLGIIVLPAALAVLNMIFPLLLKVDPKYKYMNPKVKVLLHWIIPAASILASGVTLLSALGRELNLNLIVPLFLGLVFIIIGNYLPKMTPSYTVGIKLPWTLNNEENWKKTHRMSGFLWVVGGIIMILAGVLNFRMIVSIAICIVMVIVPVIYSYILYRKGY